MRKNGLSLYSFTNQCFSVWFWDCSSLLKSPWELLNKVCTLDLGRSPPKTSPPGVIYDKQDFQKSAGRESVFLIRLMPQGGGDRSNPRVVVLLQHMEKNGPPLLPHNSISSPVILSLFKPAWTSSGAPLHCGSRLEPTKTRSNPSRSGTLGVGREGLFPLVRLMFCEGGC